MGSSDSCPTSPVVTSPAVDPSEGGAGTSKEKTDAEQGDKAMVDTEQKERKKEEEEEEMIGGHTYTIVNKGLWLWDILHTHTGSVEANFDSSVGTHWINVALG